MSNSPRLLSRLLQARGLVIALSLVLCAGPAGATGIPVVDVAGLAEAVQQYTALTEQLATLKDQYDTAVKQLDSLKQQAATMKGMYDDLSGISGHANMLQGAVTQLHSYLPAQLQDPSAMVRGELSSAVAQLRSMKERFSAEQLFPDSAQAKERELYQDQSDQAFAYKANAQAAYNKFAERRQALESLSVAGTTATTPGAKLDLIAKSNGEVALLLNDIAQMLALQVSAQADRDILAHNKDGVTQSQRRTMNKPEMQFK